MGTGSSEIQYRNQRLLKATEVAQILNISRAFAYQLMKSGKLKTVEIGSARRVRSEDLFHYIEENTQSSP